jgi:hypothetical protein
VIGPVLITLLLLFVSGIPLLERTADEKDGDDPAYPDYKRRTRILVPLPTMGLRHAQAKTGVAASPGHQLQAPLNSSASRRCLVDPEGSPS